ncbi:MAG: DUF4350 domain-containing protein [Novosphingobium sp.]|nr:DUF4350 domain-containing protein [Novosphingobium sp.]
MTAPADPFSRRAVLALVGGGALLFVLLLALVGGGFTSGNFANGGAHAGGTGLNGYAGLYRLLEHHGYRVGLSRSEAAAQRPGLLVLTPPANAKGAEIDRIVERHRQVGPVLVILPKWLAGPLPAGTPGAKRGWVALAGPAPVDWPGFLDEVTVAIAPMGAGGRPAEWSGAGAAGALPVAEIVQSGRGDRLVPLVTGRQDGRILAARLATTDGLRPLLLVFEPDLLDNYGFAETANAVLAENLVAAAGGGQDIAFDVSLNGLGRTPNLLTLAFTPPFLAATLCLLLAALAVGWRAFLRFGPALIPGRAIAFGKRALVANTAALIARTRRLHLIASPYADAARERLVRALGLPRHVDPAASEAALDRALAARTGDDAPFSRRAAALRAARRPHELVAAAQDLHDLERTLAR